MPKLNQTHLPDRLREAIEQLERGEEVEAKKNKTLLNADQQKALEDAWNEQQALRRTTANRCTSKGRGAFRRSSCLARSST